MKNQTMSHEGKDRQQKVIPRITQMLGWLNRFEREHYNHALRIHEINGKIESLRGEIEDNF